MRPYGITKRRSNIHGHNKCACDICSGNPPTRGQARMSQKIEIRREVNDVNSLQDGYDPEFWDWADVEFICGCEIEWDEWDRVVKENNKSH